MKKVLKLSLIAIAVVLLCLSVIACNKNKITEIPTPETGIGLSGFTYNDGAYKTIVDSKTESFNLKEILTVATDSSTTISKDESFTDMVDATNLSLTGGNNIFFIKVVDKYDNIATYKVNIYKKQVYTVEFNTNGGSSVNPISVEEGTVISAPGCSKPGYTLSWDYEFVKPIYSNKTINAIWTANDYKITIDLEEDQIINVKFGENYDLTEYEPTKVGYIFTGWNAVYYTEGEEIKVDFAKTGEYTFAENLTIVPKFVAQEYSITYIVEGGATNPNTDKCYTVERIPQLLNAIWKDDEKVFAGWYTSADFSEDTKVTSLSGLIGDVKLWAKFDDVTFNTKVDLIVNDATIDTVTFTYKSIYELTSPVPEKGYVFAGWYTTSDFEESSKLDSFGTWMYKNENMDLFAKFDTRINPIEYHLFGGTNGENPNEYNVEMGTVVLKDPTFGRHIFLGWYTDSAFENKISELNIDNVTEEMDIYAKWQYVSFVTFDSNEGECDIPNATYNFGEIVTLPVPQKAGNLFDAWYYTYTEMVDGEEVEKTVKVSNGEWKYKEDITLVARFIPTTIAINYQLNGGEQNAENPLSFDVFTGLITLKDPTKNDAIFAGWYTDAEYKNQITEIDTDTVREITLYAKWIESEVSVTFDANGGSVSLKNTTIVFGNQYILPTPEYLGYTFDGWYLEDTPIPTIGTWTYLTDNAKLVARWVAVVYKIEYDLGDAKVEGLVTEYTVTSDDIILPILPNSFQMIGEELVECLFMGWKDSNGNITQSYTITSGSIGDRTFTAVWLQNRDGKGFVYEFRGDHMVCVDYVRPIDFTQSIKMPRTYGGYPVKAITTNAFTSFGQKFANATFVDSNGDTQYYKNQNYYYTIYIPTTITVIETDAFADCNGMCVMLYLEDNSVVEDIKKEKDLNALLAWESQMQYSSGNSNQQVRDCIWGLRPAIGWTKYSAVQIPDVYYENQNQ